MKRKHNARIPVLFLLAAVLCLSFSSCLGGLLPDLPGWGETSFTDEDAVDTSDTSDTADTSDTSDTPDTSDTSDTADTKETETDDPTHTHDFVSRETVAPTCEGAGSETRTCTVCGETLTRVLPASGHEWLYLLPLDGGEAAAVCTRCGVSANEAVSVDWIPVPAGNSTWGYESLASLAPDDPEQVAALRALYTEWLISAVWIHEGMCDPGKKTFLTPTGMTELCVFTQSSYRSLDPDPDRALELAGCVFNALRYDSPEFYWLYEGYMHDSGTVYLLVHPDYADRADRMPQTEAVNAALERLCSVAGAPGTTSDFDRAAAVYLELMKTVTYAFTPAGVPSDTVGAHSVLGLAEGGRVVCEGYSQILQAALNRIGIPAVFVAGYAARGGNTGEAHAWNMIRLDGEWYWADATFDDESGGMYEYQMKYFGMRDADFRATHIPYDGSGVEWLYSLPEVSPKQAAPLTLLTENGDGKTEERRFLSPAAAFDHMDRANDPTACYTLCFDTATGTDLAVADPFLWDYTLPGGEWPAAASITLKGAGAIYGTGARTVLCVGVDPTAEVPRGPVLRSDLILDGVTFADGSVMKLQDHALSVGGETVRLDFPIEGGEGSSLAVDSAYMTILEADVTVQVADACFNGYTEIRGTLIADGNFTCNGDLRQSGRITAGNFALNGPTILTGVFTGGSGALNDQTTLYGTLDAERLALCDGAWLACDGGYVLRAQEELALEGDARLRLLDKSGERGEVVIGRAVGPKTASLSISLTILDAANYPKLLFEGQVGVGLELTLESEAVCPGLYTGTLLELSGGMREPERFGFRVKGQNGASVACDANGRYTFIE